MSGKSFACPRCQTQLPSAAVQSGADLQCPQCGARLKLGRRAAGADDPAASELAGFQFGELERLFTAEELAAPEPPAEEPGLTDDDLVEIVMAASVSTETRRRRRRADRPPALGAFFAGVFTFPFEREVRGRLALMSAGGVIAAELTLLALLMTSVLSSGRPGFEAITGIALGLAALLLDLLVLGFASACLLAIVEDTGNGSDRVVKWPDRDWAEWLITLRFPDAAAVGASLLAEVVRLLCEGWNIWAFVVAAVAYPYLLVSMLENGSPWMPWSAVIWRASRGQWGVVGWLLFYVASSVSFAPLAVIVWHCWPQSVGGTLLIATPVAFATLIVYHRLLGRLVDFIAVREVDGG